MGRSTFVTAGQARSTVCGSTADGMAAAGRGGGRRCEPAPPGASFLTYGGSSPDACVLVGDLMLDIAAARAAGIRVIAYANRPSKVIPFASPDAAIRTMSDVTEALTLAGPEPPDGA